jgi:hypothetical protein
LVKIKKGNFVVHPLEFDQAKYLKASSIGIFGDVVIYPFNKGIYLGLRWELINFNWLAKESQLKVEKEKDYSATSLYTGTCGFFQMGYAFNLGNNTKLKVYAQSGL